ncbi:MAG: DUF4440 domain-containing protein [Pseudomonadota bacterium]
MDEDLQRVEALEMELLDPAARKSSARLRELIADDFEEFGKSGSAFSKGDIVRALLTENYSQPEVSELRSRKLAPDVVLVKYVTVNAGATAHRSSIWVRTAGAWQITHHQGTHRR